MVTELATVRQWLDWHSYGEAVGPTAQVRSNHKEREDAKMEYWMEESLEDGPWKKIKERAVLAVESLIQV